MAGLLGGGPKRPTVDKPHYTGVQVQTAVNTLPIPIVYGCARGAPNLIDYTDYAAHADKAQQGGKGGGSSDSTAQSYTATVIMGLCEGPIAGIGKVWTDSTTTTNYQSLGFSLFVGTAGQTAWGYMASKHADKALGYPGTAYLAQANYLLGSSPSLPNHNMEIFGFLTGTCNVAGNPDADMALVIRDFLTNPQYGVGFPDASIDLSSLLSTNYLAGHGYAGSNDASYQSYCAALGLFMSPALFSQESASAILARWLMLTNTAAVWSGTKLRFIPYGDVPEIGNGVTFTPDVTPIYDLSDDDFMAEDGRDPIEITRSDLADAKNCVRVEIADRANAYNLTPVEAKDQNAIELYGMRVDAGIAAHEICDPVTCAPMVAQLIVQRNIHIRNTYTFRLSWEYCLLEPMDLVTLTDPALGLNKTAVRITAIEEDEQGLLTVTAEEFPFGVASATLYPKQGRNPYIVNYNTPASPVNAPVIFEPAADLSGGVAQVWIGASGGLNGAADPYWGGCEVWLSLDNVTYQQIGRIDAPARQGVLAANLPLAAGIDATNALAVDLSESGGVLGSGNQADAQAGRTLVWADGEIMGYATADLVALGHYNLSYLVRGLHGTVPALHYAGSQFLRLDEAVFKYDLPAAYVGMPLFIKLPSFNVWGAGAQGLADAHAYGLTPTGIGYYIAPPTGALITSSARTAGDGMHLLSVAITWTASAGPLLDHYEAQWRLQGDAGWQSVIVGGNATDTVITPARENATYEARVRAVSTTGNLSAWDVAGSAGSGALSTTVPTAPTGFAGGGGIRNIALRWNANPEPDIEGYRVLAAAGSDSNIGDAATIGLTQATNFTFANLGYGEAWTFWLEAYNIAGASQPAGPLTFATDYTIPVDKVLTEAITESLLAPSLISAIDSGGSLGNVVLQQAHAALSDAINSIQTANQLNLPAKNYTDGLLLAEAGERKNLAIQIGQNNASFTSKIQLVANQNSATATAVTQVAATVAQNAATATQGIQAAATAASAAAQSVTQLATTVQNNAANATQGILAAATAASAAAQSVTDLSGVVDQNKTAATQALTAATSATSSLATSITDLSGVVDQNKTTAHDELTQATSPTSSIGQHLSNLDSEMGSNFAQIQQVFTTTVNSDGSATAVGLFKFQVDANGKKAISGFGAASEIVNGVARSEVTFLASNFLFSTVNPDGTINEISPLFITGNQVYIDTALINKVQANALTSGTISSANIEIHPPPDGSGGLKVYNSAGVLVLDPTHGLAGGSATPQVTARFDGLHLTTTLQPILDMDFNFSGRMAEVYLLFKTNLSTTGGLDNNVQVEVTIDGAEEFGSNSLATGVSQTLPIKFVPPAGVHRVTVSIGTRTSSTDVSVGFVGLTDFKA